MALKDKYINPFTDFGFKKLFGSEPNKELLVDFLNLFLPNEHQITELHYGNNETQGRTEFDRKAILDIYCTGANGEQFIVEMQKAKQDFFKDRSVFYTSFPIQSQAERGEWNYNLNFVYFFGVLDFIFADHKDDVDMEHHVTLKNQHGVTFYKKLKFVYLEMPKFKKQLHELETLKDKWFYILKNLQNMTEQPDLFKNPLFEQLFTAAEIAKFDKKEANAYEESLKIYRDMHSVIATSHNDGIKIGLEKGEQIGLEKGEQIGLEKGEQIGMEKAAIEGIKKQLQRGRLLVEEIAEDFDVTVEFVLEIKNSL